VAAKKISSAMPRRRASKATRGARRAAPDAPKMKVVKDDGAERGGQKSTRKKQHKRSRTLAEQRGLAGRDQMISAAVDFPSTVAVVDPLRILNLQFRVWMSLMKMSPLPIMLRQYTTLSRAMMEPTPSRKIRR
jgi:hypothetical protein